MKKHNLQNAISIEPLYARLLDANEEHSHAEGQLFCLSTGLAVVESGTGRVMIAPQQIGWIPPGVLHRAEEHGSIAGWATYLAPGLFATLPNFPCVLQCSPFIPLIMERAVAWQKGDSLSTPQKCLLRVFLDELCSARPLRQGLPFPDDKRLGEMAALLSRNPADARDLSEWAKTIGMSVRNLSRRFREETGMTFSQWRQFARVYKGRELLASGVPVQEAAWSSGYESVSSFIAVFKDIFGVTPGELAAKSTGDKI